MMTVLFSSILLATYVIDHTMDRSDLTYWYFENAFAKKHKYIETQNSSIWEKAISQ